MKAKRVKKLKKTRGLNGLQIWLGVVFGPDVNQLKQTLAILQIKYLWHVNHNIVIHLLLCFISRKQINWSCLYQCCKAEIIYFRFRL